MEYPQVIQGGMGIAVSSWRLASAVARRRQLGVVSSTGLDLVFTRRLQLGDQGGHLRRALDHFPVPDMAERVWARYFIPGGNLPTAPYKSKPVPTVKPSRALNELIVVSNFAEVFLAKEGHEGKIGINLLEKIQIPTLASLFGAMLADVDFVLMGAGIPRSIPAILDHLAALEEAEHHLDVIGAEPGEVFAVQFDPKEFCPPDLKALKRPEFLAIVSSSTLALSLARKSTGKVNGFVVEGPIAGGHNAPPRGHLTLDDAGEPIYGPRDVPELGQFREIGLPFWLAGGYGTAAMLQEALRLGAQGIQVGTPFAFCEESEIKPEIKAEAIRQSIEHRTQVFTDPWASPTGFPFKVLGMTGTLSDCSVYCERERICDLGYLRELYRDENGKVGYRCNGEPVEDFLRKGGNIDDIPNRKCLCNGLLETIGLGQVRDGVVEPAIVTAGDDVANVSKFLLPGKETYTADDVLNNILGLTVGP